MFSCLRINPFQTNLLIELIKRQSCRHIETSQLICRANQLTSFYMMATLAFNELMLTLYFNCYKWHIDLKQAEFPDTLEATVRIKNRCSLKFRNIHKTLFKLEREILHKSF